MTRKYYFGIRCLECRKLVLRSKEKLLNGSVLDASTVEVCRGYSQKIANGESVICPCGSIDFKHTRHYKKPKWN